MDIEDTSLMRWVSVNDGIPEKNITVIVAEKHDWLSTPLYGFRLSQWSGTAWLENDFKLMTGFIVNYWCVVTQPTVEV